MTDSVLLLVTVLHLVVAFFLIVFVLLQDSKGGALGALGTGGSHSLFGSTGASNFLVTTTKWAAIVFTVTCLTLTWHTTQQGTSVLDEVPLPTQNGAAQSGAAQGDTAQGEATQNEAVQEGAAPAGAAGATSDTPQDSTKPDTAQE